MNEILFDRKLLHKRKIRFAADFAHHDFLYREIANRILENLSLQNRKFENVLEIGSEGNFFAENLSYKTFLMTRVCKDKSSNLLAKTQSNTIICDDEDLPNNLADFDLIISNLNLHFINNLPQFLLRVHKALRKNGLFIASFFGERNLFELADAIYLAENELYCGVSPIMPPMIDIKTAANLLNKSGFKNAVSDFERIVVDYVSPMILLDDIKKNAANNLLHKRSKRFFSKRFLNKILENYTQKFPSKNGAVKASFEIVTVSGEK